MPALVSRLLTPNPEPLSPISQPLSPPHQMPQPPFVLGAPLRLIGVVGMGDYCPFEMLREAVQMNPRA